MKILLLSLLLNIGTAAVAQHSNNPKELTYLCEVKFNLITKTIESSLTSDQSPQDFRRDSLKMTVLSEVRKKATTVEILFLFLQNKWHLIASVQDCQTSTMIFFFTKSLPNTINKKNDTVIIDGRKRML